MNNPPSSSLVGEFFASGFEETISPFLTPGSRKWGRNLSLKASYLSAFLLAIAFFFSFFQTSLPICHLCLTFVYFFAGIPALIASVQDIASFRINIDVLMTLAAFSSILIGSPLEGALLLVLFSFSEAMEDAVTGKAKKAISELKEISPTKACILNEKGHYFEKSIHDVSIGTKILVKAGELIPLDGRVIQGTSTIHLSHLTGEVAPILKKVGDMVSSGARNIEGMLVIEVTHTSQDSTIAKIIHLVTQATENKPKLQSFLDKFSHFYALAVIGFSFLAASLLPLFFAIPYMGPEGSIYRSIAFLIAASPCALIIAMPIAYLSSISACAKKGVLLKGGITLDALAQCQMIAFDKTGTLTQGILQCEKIYSYDDQNQEIDKAIQYAASLERNIKHPIAKALVQLAYQKNLTLLELDCFRSIAGYGLEAKINGESVLIGNLDFLLPKLEEKIALEVSEKIKQLMAFGKQYSLLLIKKLASFQLFIFEFSDQIRPDTQKQLAQLKNECHLRTLMLTGDHFASAKKVAEQIGVDDFFADLKPEDKLIHIEQLAKKKSIAMVGDGINDGPALARANVGIAMGKIGSRTAHDAADIILLQDDLGILCWLFKKAKSTVNIVRQNLWIAACAILFATTPALLGLIPLWLAVILHEGGTVLVGLNALRLLKK